MVKPQVFRYKAKPGALICNQGNPTDQCPHCGTIIDYGPCFLDFDSEKYINTIDVRKCPCVNWIGITQTTGGVHPADYLGFVGRWTTVYGIEYYLYVWLKIVSAKKIQRWWRSLHFTF